MEQMLTQIHETNAEIQRFVYATATHWQIYWNLRNWIRTLEQVHNTLERNSTNNVSPRYVDLSNHDIEVFTNALTRARLKYDQSVAKLVREIMESSDCESVANSDYDTDDD